MVEGYFEHKQLSRKETDGKLEALEGRPAPTAVED